jgi:hypothetical protein
LRQALAASLSLALKRDRNVQLDIDRHLGGHSSPPSLDVTHAFDELISRNRKLASALKLQDSLDQLF